MKKLILVAMLTVCMCGCVKVETTVVEPTQNQVEVEMVETVEEPTYTKEMLHGRYYTDGYVVADSDCSPLYDGQEWNYIEDDRLASDVEVYDGIPIYFVVALADDGDLSKSYICTDADGNGLVLDRAVMLMDILEETSEDFDLEREDDYNIRLKGMK